VPPKALTVPLAADIIAGKEFTQDAAVRETANAVARVGALGHLESADPCSLVAIANLDPGARCEGGSRVRVECRPPSAHATIVLMMTARR